MHRIQKTRNNLLEIKAMIGIIITYTIGIIAMLIVTLLSARVLNKIDAYDGITGGMCLIMALLWPLTTIVLVVYVVVSMLNDFVGYGK